MSVKKGQWFMDFGERAINNCYRPCYVSDITDKTITVQQSTDAIIIDPEEVSHYPYSHLFNPTLYESSVYRDKLLPAKTYNLPYITVSKCVYTTIKLINNEDLVVFDTYDEIRKIPLWNPSKVIHSKKATKVINGLVRTQLPVELKYMISQWV
jgi:hypothetical protein